MLVVFRSDVMALTQLVNSLEPEKQHTESPSKRVSSAMPRINRKIDLRRTLETKHTNLDQRR